MAKMSTKNFIKTKIFFYEEVNLLWEIHSFEPDLFDSVSSLPMTLWPMVG